VKSSLSVHHSFAARFFAKQATQLEEGTSAPTEEQQSEHRAYVLGTVFCATAFIEAYINELYLSATEGSPDSEFGLDDTRASKMADKWRKDGENTRWYLLKKFQDALTCSNLTPYSVEASPYKEASKLTALRNAVTHYKPEWDDAQKQHADIDALLQGEFPESRFASRGQIFFPHRCLGAGCAAWAVATASNLVRDFSTKMELKDRFPIEP
jgi:hypothetical protein